ncbi:MAG: hopanoid biosynthesis-associated protein HpnK [Armatimonadetes bacterium]|nr:hopanoid biosynthesis-associated protein HpnK [Armatimonadota bacterium]
MARLPITLVVNADDFGLSEQINQGIESAFQQGILRSASLMPNGAAFDDAVQIARRNPGLGVGVHISLVDEHCTAAPDEVRGLIDRDGCLPHSYGAFIAAYAGGRFGIREIRAEVSAQVARALETGLDLTHIDSHQHLHVLPRIRRVVLDAARSAGIGVVRVPYERGTFGSRMFSARGAQVSALSLLAAAFGARAGRAGMRHADHFWGLAASGHMDETALCAVLGQLRDGVNEIMMHPGFTDAKTSERYQWGYRWDDEAAALVSERVRQAVRERDIRLANFATAWEEPR